LSIVRCLSFVLPVVNVIADASFPTRPLRRAGNNSLARPLR
jgi:hypothetical protein